MQKGASNTELKKSAPPDDDFGKDFFDSWKSEKLGNESMDFDMETIPKNKKPSFKFDELDNFELSGNFDKLSSFKLDVPDLDFPGPSKKTEKTHEKSSKEFVPGKKESKENKFSFDFDFNSFDIASKSPEERPSNLSDKKVQEHSSKLATNQVSAGNISTSTNISRDRHSDFARKTEVFLGKRNVIAEDNQKQTNVTLASHEKYLPTENSDNDQDACLQTSSDGSTEVTLHGIQTDNTTLDVGKLRTKMEMTKSMHLISSSPSRSSSPVSSYNSGYRTKPSGKELSKPDSEIQKHQSRNPLTRITGSLTDSFQVRKQVHDSTCTKRSVEGVKDMDEKQNTRKNHIPPNKQSSPQNLMQPSVKREFTFGGSSKLSGLLNTDFQLNNISKLGSSIPQQSPAFMSKPLGSMLEARTKSTHASTSNDSSLQFKTSTASHQPSIGAKSIVESTLPKLSTDATVDPKVSPAGYNMTSMKENSKPKLVSSTRLGCQNISTDKDTSLDDNNHCGILNSAIAKTREVNSNKTNSSKPRETKSVHFLEKRMDCPLNAVNSINIEKHVSFHAPLKRKIDEESVTDLQTSSPLKCVKESTANKRLFASTEYCMGISTEPSQSAKMKMAPEIKITETNKDVTPVTNRTSITAATEMGNLVTGVSSNVEDEENLRKTETLTKDLDKICSALRKKHEEAKELQVRSIINNSALLLLNHSILEENIQALQKFTTSLLLMEI